MIETPPNKNASPSAELQAGIISAITDAIKALGHNVEGLDLTLRPIPLEGAWGFGSAVAFQLKKQGAQGSPMEVAERIAAALPTLQQIERVEVVNNYINFYVDKDWYANRVVAQVLSETDEYGCWPPRGERVMVEYANLNTHKTMHVGHLRNVVLGAAIFNILKCAGFDTVGATYIGDIGLHVMRTMWAYMSFHRGQEPDADRGAWLEKIYIEAVARQEYRSNVVGLIEDAAKADPAIAAQLTLSLQSLAETDLRDRPYAEKLANTLLTRDGPDWNDVITNREHIVLNLWDELGRMLTAQTSTLDTTNS
ncbi:MAG TPA: arginine--tRNA ligase, partial [Chloroflexia bacterium]|nr:arginine--tRNA ligase [Chloroflexia bacterium]